MTRKTTKRKSTKRTTRKVTARKVAPKKIASKKVAVKKPTMKKTEKPYAVTYRCSNKLCEGIGVKSFRTKDEARRFASKVRNRKRGLHLIKA